VYDDYMKRRTTLSDHVTHSDVTAGYSGVVVTELADYEEYDSTVSTATGESTVPYVHINHK
jgi:hypothetical protein